MNFAPDQFFDLDRFAHSAVFEQCTNVWDVLVRLGPYLEETAWPEQHGTIEDGAHITGAVFIGEGTIVRAGAWLNGPCIIGKNCEVRPGAYVRGHALIGDGCVVGNSTELKNTIMLDGAQAPHYNYCGDSVIGNLANLGAGTKLSNFKIAADKTIRLQTPDGVVDTGLIKFGAILGDRAVTGCNSVLNPGTVVGRNAMIYACASVRGFIPADTIVKLQQTLEMVPRRP